MKLLKLVSVLIILLTLLFNVAFTLIQNHETDEHTPLVEVDGSEEPSTQTVSRFLAQQKPKKQSCDKFPRVCSSKGSPGPDCCKKNCVNVMTDRLNCGMCGYKCKYSQVCCGGKCINPSVDMKNCGGCNKRCKQGEFCAYGTCNYA